MDDYTILLPIFMFGAIILYVIFFGFGIDASAPDKARAERESYLKNSGFHPCDDTQAGADAVALVQRQLTSCTLAVQECYRSSEDPAVQALWAEVQSKNSDSDAPEMFFVVRLNAILPESFVLRAKALNGFAGKMLGFVIGTLQMSHLQALELEGESLKEHYKIHTADPEAFRNWVTPERLEGFEACGAFELHISGNLCVIRLMHLMESGTLQRDFTRLRKIGAAIRAT